MYQKFLDKNPYLQGKHLALSLILYISGLITIGAGAVLTINSHAGAGGYDALTFVLAEKFNTRVSTIIYLIAILSVLLTGIIRGKFPRITTFITAFLLGLVVDFWKVVLANFHANSLITSIVFFVIGILLIGYGVAAYLISKFPANPIDDFVLALTEKGVSLQVAKLGFDIPCFVIAILLHGQIGWGSVFITATLGPLIQVWHNLINRILVKFNMGRK